MRQALKKAKIVNPNTEKKYYRTMRKLARN